MKRGIVKNFIFATKTIYSIEKKYIFERIIASLSYTISVVLYPYIVKIVVNGLVEQEPFLKIVYRTIAIVLIVMLFSAIYQSLQDTFWYKSNKIRNLLIHQVSLKTLDIDYQLLERPETQDTIEKTYRTLNNHSGIIGLVNQGFYSLQYLLTFLISSAIVVTINPWLLLIICALSFLKVIVETKRSKKNKEINDKLPFFWRKKGYIYSISTNMSIGKDLRIYRMNDFINKQYDNVTKKLLAREKERTIKGIIYNVLINAISFFDALFLYGFMIYEVLYNNMAIDTFTFMISSVLNLTSNLYYLINNNAEVLRCSLEINDYYKFSKIDIDADEQEDFAPTNVEIEFRNVYYSYYGQEGYALEDVSFKIGKGEKIALVGYNGAGKTTIVKLISGLYHPTKGEILINGINIEKISRVSLSKLIAPVFQETVVFAASVMNNISMNEEADEKRVEEIVSLVELDNKIQSLPDKLKTVLTKELDEKGIEFSGGETQKLSLARAIYKNSPLFILDEPTSSLDAISELHMYENFNKMISNNSSIFISHRLSSTRFCDRILFLSHGRIIEDGTHIELMAKDSEYKKLFDMQAEYYKDGNTNEAEV